jgi:serine/threonine protein kinase
VMEFLEGTTLQERIKSRGRLTPPEIAPLVIQLLEGLAAAHDAGIVHRDLKPANIFLSRTQAGDFVKVLDFGVSKFNVLDGGEGMQMTRTGTVLGTPYYMSPEQAKGAKGIDGRSDLYAVGVILYESITGHVPFSAETFNELIFRIVLESPPPAEQFVPDLDGAFAVILRKAMAREPEQRFQDAREFRATLVAWIESQRLPSYSLAQGGSGTMLMQGARGGTMMMDADDNAATTAFALGQPHPLDSYTGVTQLALPRGAPPAVPISSQPAPIESGPEPLPARREGMSGTTIAILAMGAAAVLMGSAAAGILSRNRVDASAPSASVSVPAPVSISVPVSVSVSAENGTWPVIDS